MDNLDNLIQQRIEERQRKLDFIKNKSFFGEDETNGKSRKKIFYSVLSVAACIGLFLLISPGLFNRSDISGMNITAPGFEEYRGMSNDSICDYLSQGRYDEAMPLIDRSLKESYSEIETLSKSPYQSEETKYLLQIERDFLSEIMWSKIYVLVKRNQQEELEKIITEYLEIQENQVHEEEALKILKEIQ